VGKSLPIRDQPGASASAEGRRARRAAVRRGRVTAVLALGAVILVAAGIETGRPPLLVTAVVAAALAWRWRPDLDPDRWGRGAAGEVETARLLARLPRRYVVLHDRRHLADRGNLDHLVIGPSGVWLVDSKVRRARLTIRRGRVWAGDFPIDVSAVAAQADRLAERLGVAVAPVVAVHGPGLRRRGKLVDGVRVLPAARLVPRLRRGRRLWPSEIVALAAEVDRLFPPVSIK
jgi:hypothetical protein